MLMLSLASCASTCSDLQGKALAAVAPDVPDYSKDTANKAADEIDGGACPAMTVLLEGCAVTRAQARLLRGK